MLFLHLPSSTILQYIYGCTISAYVYISVLKYTHIYMCVCIYIYNASCFFEMFVLICAFSIDVTQAKDFRTRTGITGRSPLFAAYGYDIVLDTIPCIAHSLYSGLVGR
jgi:hypothetical protein